VLNRDARCARCDAALRTGDGGFRGLSDEPGPPLFCCRACIRRLGEPGERKDGTS
jgi:hypothetical protein